MRKQEVIDALLFLLYDRDKTARGDGYVTREVNIENIKSKINSPFFTKFNGESKNSGDKTYYYNTIAIDHSFTIKSYLFVWNKAYRFLTMYITNYGTVYGYKEGTADINFIINKEFKNIVFGMANEAIAEAINITAIAVPIHPNSEYKSVMDFKEEFENEIKKGKKNG